MRCIEKMNGFVSACAILLFLVSCAGEKGGRQRVETSPAETEVMTDTLLAEEEEWFEAVERKSAADGLFEDFLLNFSTDSSFQCQRVVFPLSLVGGEAGRQVLPEEWMSTSPFNGLESYVTLYDSEEELEMEKDTSLQAVEVEYIHATGERVCSYDFVRKENRWNLTGIKEHALSEYANGEFVSFLLQFVSDSLFQSRHVSDPLSIATIDPEDDFNILEATIDAEQWASFAPPMPGGGLVNINYGQRCRKRAGMKIVMLKGVGNGYCNALYFRKHGDRWMLTRYEDVGN